MTHPELTSINDTLRLAGPHRTRPIRFVRPDVERYLSRHTDTQV